MDVWFAAAMRTLESLTGVHCTTINNSIIYTRYPKAPFEKGKNNVYESEACCVKKDVLEITPPLYVPLLSPYSMFCNKLETFLIFRLHVRKGNFA